MLKASRGDASAYDYATIYAQWGNVAETLDWLETALRLRDPALSGLKTEPSSQCALMNAYTRRVAHGVNRLDTWPPTCTWQW
jgi:hypothetical protein